MKISVVILNWNRPEDTITASHAILQQGHEDFDLIIWDNASTDDSRKILTDTFGHDERVKLVWSDENYGVAGGRNRAFAESNGDLIVSLDSDCFVQHDDALALIDQFMSDHPQVGAVSFELLRTDGHVLWPFSRPLDPWRDRSFETLRADGGAMAVRRNVFNETGGFAEHFSPYGVEDQLFSCRVINLGYQLWYLPAIKVVHAFTERGRTSTEAQMHVRNSLWLPLESFPMPYAFLSFSRTALYLLKDAVHYGYLPSYFKGLFSSFAGYKPSRRQPLSGKAWMVRRRLVNQEKEASRG